VIHHGDLWYLGDHILFAFWIITLNQATTYLLLWTPSRLDPRSYILSYSPSFSDHPFLTLCTIKPCRLAIGIQRLYSPVKASLKDSASSHAFAAGPGAPWRRNRSDSLNKNLEQRDTSSATVMSSYQYLICEMTGGTYRHVPNALAAYDV
jgi:hypothetical protein